MKWFSAILALAAVSSVVEATSSHGFISARKHARRSEQGIAARSNSRRCPAKKTTTSTPAATATHTSAAASTSTSKSGSTNTGSTTNTGTTTSQANGLVKAGSSACGASGATRAITTTSGPNGNIDWIDCGINGGGWNPPRVTMADIVYVDLSTALKSPSTPYKACAPYLQYFNKYGQQYGIPPIFLAAFAMQESSCNPATIGGGGEQGLMQITADKCPNGQKGEACRDPNFNIQAGAKYFSEVLKSNDGDLFRSVGNYNGWAVHMTYAQATKAAHSGCCRCQNNLDYLHQFFNGWIQNVDAYTHKLGKYFNLNVCG